MATISKLSAIVTANIAGFSAGMKEAGEHAEGFGERFKRVAEGVTEAAAILGIGLSAESFVEYLKGTYEAIEANERLSISLGVSTQALGHLEFAAKIAGVSQDSLTSGLTKMLKALDTARDGGKDAVAAFDKLGLSAKDFVGLNAEQSFEKIASATNNAKDRAAALHATVAIFGKSAGAELLPLLNMTAEQFEEVANKADKTGFALNDIESAKVAEAGEKMREFEGAVQGAANKLIVAMAPYLTAVAEKLNQVSSSGGGMAQHVVNGFEMVVQGIAKATDYVELLEASWDTLKAGAEYSIAGIQKVLAYLIESFTKALDVLHISHDATTQFVEDLKKSHRDMMDSGDKAWQAAQDHIDNFSNGTNSEKVSKFFDGIKKQSDKTAQEIVDNNKKIFGAGAFAEGDDAPDKASEKAFKKMQDEAKKLYEESRTPMEKFQDQIEKINELFGEGAIDPDTYSRAIKKAEDDLDKATKKKEKFQHLDVNAPQLLEAGSAEASQFIAKFQAQSKENEREKEILAENRKQREIQQRMLAAIEDSTALYVLNWS